MRGPEREEDRAVFNEILELFRARVGSRFSAPT